MDLRDIVHQAIANAIENATPTLQNWRNSMKLCFFERCGDGDYKTYDFDASTVAANAAASIEEHINSLASNTTVVVGADGKQYQITVTECIK